MGDSDGEEEAAEAEVATSEENEHRNELAFRQFERLHEAESALAPERPGIADLYFIGGAGWADQDVFLREARTARDLFDRQFGTQGRSLLLANNASARDLPPVTNVTLRHAMKKVGALMNHEEDVLFLFITSHGSAHGIALDYGRGGGFRHEVLKPVDLRSMLDEAGIKWRVLVISGCESGVFIAPLKNEQTLVVTASAADRPSYGCAQGNAFTESGRPLFDEELPRNPSFITAFENVAATIAQREAKDGLLASRPQVARGSQIAAKLREIAERAGPPDSVTTTSAPASP
ncbi:MAG: putative rane protein [Labilithrix sp.]|nr:putative rane protein [Labilithrix sp.]